MKLTTQQNVVIEHEVDSPEARERIELIQARVDELPPAECEVTHTFADGIYARSGLIKKNTVMVGAIKRLSHINVIDGDVSIYTEEGEKRLTGKVVMQGSPGTKRVIIAHADTWWTTIIHTNETNPESAWDDVIATTHEDYLKRGAICLG